jgi:hypothetical protein
VLGLVNPDTAADAAKAAAAAAKPAEPAKPVEPKPAEPVKPAEPAEPPAKKVTVKHRPSVKDEVKKALEEHSRTTPAPAKPAEPVKPIEPAATKPVAPAEDADLLPEEREELELAAYAEKKDPSKKGLAEKFRTFYKKQKEFIDKAAAKAAEEGEEYDPTTDPKFKQFLTANAPKFAHAERQKTYRDMVTEQAKTDAVKEAEAAVAPKLSELERKTRELEHRPVVNNRVNNFISETAQGMPEEIVSAFREHGNDLAKVEAAMPLEFKIVRETMTGAKALADELLSLNSGLVEFDPEKNSRHRYLNTFVREQAEVFERRGGDALVRNGKTFIQPEKWTPEVAATHWTFDSEDVLRMLSKEAQRQVKTKISEEEARLKSLGFSRAPRHPAPNSATAPSAIPPAEQPSSPRTTPAPLPGAAATGDTKESALHRVLGLGV